MSSHALAVYDRLMAQVQAVRDAAEREAAAGYADGKAVLLRSCLVLAVAALDTYMHEQGVRLLALEASKGQTEAARVVAYLGRLIPSQVSGASASQYIRYRLSYKTLVAPDKIDDLFVAIGQDAEDLWLQAAMAVGSRPERLKTQTQLQVDRRNQIAHEGDWDSVTLDFRALENPHLDDCVNHLNGVVHSWDALLP